MRTRLLGAPVVVLGALAALLGGVALSAGLGSASTAPTLASPSALALGAVPADYLAWDQQAALTCPGLSWTVLAGIGHVESSNGISTLPGVHSGANFAGAEGPMQFEPATFAAYATVGPGGADPPNPYDPVDAIWSAARMLCDDGAAQPGGLTSAIFAYNHSAAYVAQVMATADAYATSSPAAPSGLAAYLISAAESYVGTPYVWGGEAPGVGFDCSGLVQWVFAEAGVALPRVAQDQYNATAHLAPGATLVPGDLVFFGPSTTAIEHVGIYIGNGDMVDAPHTGALVRIEPMPMFTPAFVAASAPELASPS
ncbi:MAG: NlpC/P60 family protein [Acidimicrobiales bacterium]